MTPKTTQASDTTPPDKFSSVNQVLLVGRLTVDPQLHSTSGGSVARLRVATNDTKAAEFHDVVVWGDDAEQVAGSVTKGSPVRVEGRLRTRTWSGSDGTSRRTTEIVAKTVEPYRGRS
jgi:single-strand DNA-binding protein